MSAPSSTASRRSDPGLDDDLVGFDGSAALIRAWARGLRPDPDLTVSSWADRHRKLASRASAEPGHVRALAAMQARPLLDLGLRLGEGTGAALALQIVRSAVNIFNDMAPFAEAGVSDAG